MGVLDSRGTAYLSLPIAGKQIDNPPKRRRVPSSGLNLEALDIEAVNFDEMFSVAGQQG